MVNKFKNILTGNLEILNSTIEESIPSETKFTWLAPHSGLYVPDYALNLLSEQDAVFSEIFKDGDPWTNNFDFRDIGGHGIHTKIHRDVSDPNRSIDRKDFIRNYSFHGEPIVVGKIDNATRKKLESLSVEYWNKIKN